MLENAERMTVDSANLDEHFANPMTLLAAHLGDIEYPVPIADNWIRVLMAIMPCGILVAASLAWEAGEPFLLAFAGAFASIQLVEPFKIMSQAVADHLSEAREKRLSALSLAQMKWAHQNRPMIHFGMAPVGYSPRGRARAQRRFRRIAVRWRRHFCDLVGQMRDPITGQVTPAAAPWRMYSSPRVFDLENLVRGGRWRITRLMRLLVGLTPYVWSLLRARIADMSPIRAAKDYRTRRLLTTVGRELIRATNRSDGDLAVRTLAAQWSIDYRPPKIQRHWVFGEPGSR